jgi:3-hydroxybutyryl-CoA dehydrogenase
MGLSEAELADADFVLVAGAAFLEVRRLALRDALAKASRESVVLVHCAPWSVTELASTLRRTERVVGFSVAGDLDRVALVEVAVGLNSDPATLEPAQSLFRRLGKQSLQVGDGSGLVLGRLLALAIDEALAISHDCGLSFDQVDQLAVEALGFPRGPLAWADLLGLDTVLQTLRNLHQDYGDGRYRAAIRLRRHVQAGRPLRASLA